MLKYAAHLSGLASCPPAGSDEQDRVAYRFVNNPITARDMEPPFILKPERRNSAIKDDDCCSGYGLSMFVTAMQAENFFRKWQNKNRNFGKLVGDHIAEGQLKRGHGKQTATRPDGHFDLHEYAGTSLLTVFKIVRAL